MPDNERTLLDAIEHYPGSTAKELANAIGLPVERVRSFLRRALTRDLIVRDQRHEPERARFIYWVVWMKCAWCGFVTRHETGCPGGNGTVIRAPDIAKRARPIVYAEPPQKPPTAWKRLAKTDKLFPDA